VKLDDAWIKAHGLEMDEQTARFLLSVLERGKLKFPLTEEAVAILKRRAGVLPPPATPKPPPPPFITPALDQQSQAAGEREEIF
jgi:hypothetical protein